MDWIKVRAEHISPSYTDAQAGALLKFLLLVARLRRVPEDKELFREVSKKNWSSLLVSMNLFGVDIDLIASNIIEDCEKVQSRTKKNQEYQRSSRLKRKNVSADRKNTEKKCQHTEEREEREEKDIPLIVPLGEQLDIGSIDDAFEILWKKYPKRDGKKAALRHFNASVKTPKDFQDIQKALKNYNLHCKGRSAQYIKNGSTWFNNWKDWVDYEPLEDNQVSESGSRSLKVLEDFANSHPPFKHTGGCEAWDALDNQLEGKA